ncbi:hypothetical protein INR49_031296 [Caranx melampygus]|nr:hypothetical protein INR49_031296 [Caranx melampygus]
MSVLQEAVAIQLEEERLVKIRDVLKELPTPHYRTLEFLMRHLVRMASHSSETNMHARNLAIVWAPNLLRSKDIEATGFNGTAAFMEVRVQSIVVEFILTHVPQLFPEKGVSTERRKSLPSPTSELCQDETLFKSMPPHLVTNFGNISPGDGPPPIRPYHAIIEGTDKRKGSLKGRKWMSIFNIGGRFPDPRRRLKHSAKEKDRTPLRPARSMDSLSSPSYQNEGSRRSAQRPPSTNMSAQASPSPPSGAEVSPSTGAMGGSEYAVTYRRGTGLVSGGAGTQGTYTALDPEGLGSIGSETLQSRSPGLSTKAGRRAAMHITGPTLVTVPLHITSNLALGVLQGGGSNRIVHCSRDKDGGGDRVEGRDGGDKVDRKESRATEMKMEEGRKAEEEEKDRVAGGNGEEEAEGEKEEEEEKGEEEVREDGDRKSELVTRGVSREQRVKNLNSNTDDYDAAIYDPHADDGSDYMDMQGIDPNDPQPEVTQSEDVCVDESPDVLNSTGVEKEDQELFGYVQDNFEFLDQMDCSVMDHMDCGSSSYQVQEFLVEPPGHSDDEYEVMAQAQPPSPPPPPELQTQQHPDPETLTQSPAQLNPHRPLSLDLHTRHTKSLSLPYMTSPVDGPEGCSSEEDDVGDESDDEYSSEEDESMFCLSLPADIILNSLSGIENDTVQPDNRNLDGLPVDPSHNSLERLFETLHIKEPTSGDAEVQKQGEVMDEADVERVKGKQIPQKEEEDSHEQEQPENHMQSTTAEEDLNIVDVQRDKEVSTHSCEDFPPPIDEEIDELSTIEVDEEEGEEEVVENPPRDDPTHHMQQIDDASLKEPREDPINCDEGDVKEKHSDEEEYRRGIEEVEPVCIEGKANQKDGEKMQEGGKEQDGEICSDKIRDELEDFICEVTEGEESDELETDGVLETDGGREEQRVKVPIDEIKEVKEEQAQVRIEVEEESTEENLTDQEKETSSPETSEREEAFQGKTAVSEEARHHDREEVVSKEPEKEKHDREKADGNLRSPPSADKQVNEETTKKLKCDESDAGLGGGVGRKLVVSQNPKVYQVKAVPVVPPKPQHCKITALTLRQQQQQRDRREADRGREVGRRVQAEPDRGGAGEQGRDGGERERERDATRDASSRNSPQACASTRPLP